VVVSVGFFFFDLIIFLVIGSNVGGDFSATVDDDVMKVAVELFLAVLSPGSFAPFTYSKKAR
jgi:hypothetical protein